jgi:CYTH domain-containing protein
MLAGDHGKYSKYEIERKFVAKIIPDEALENFRDIEDKYIINSSLRLRLEKSKDGQITARKFTKKDRDPANDATTSIITSLYLSKSDFQVLSSLPGAELKKRRYSIETNNNRITFDVFQGGLEGLILAEIEFQDQDSCRTFNPPYKDWIEVTGEPRYSGGSLAFEQNI